jgi:hypothetical protein
MADKRPYKIEISNEECRFLQYALNLMDNAINGIPSDTRYDTDVNKIGLREAIDYLGLIIGTRDKTLEDAAGNDKQKALGLLNSLHEKLLKVINT